MEQLYKHFKSIIRDYAEDERRDGETKTTIELNIWNVLDDEEWDMMEELASLMNVTISELKEDTIEQVMKTIH